MPDDPPIAFASSALEPPSLEIRVNFGIFAGREATPAELDEIGRAVMTEAGHVTIVSEHRHELDGSTETSLHQVRVAVPWAVLPHDVVEAGWVRDRLIRLCEDWALGCIEERHAEVVELFPGRSPQLAV